MRYLTKSRFKLAEECPTKLYYTRKKEYPDKSLVKPQTHKPTLGIWV